MAKARSVNNYTLAYSGEKSVSPFSSTIISTVLFPTAAAATCAEYCNDDSLCAAIELFVERVPSYTPEPSARNPPPAYQVVCRLHNKALAGSDARHLGRFYQAFYRTQTNVLFHNRNGFKKAFGASLDAPCMGGASCGDGFVCSAFSKRCKLAEGQPCSSVQDDSKCITGLCSTTGPFTPSHCVAQSKRKVSQSEHCLADADCGSQNCVSSTKICGPKAAGAKCFDHFECESQFCSFTGSEKGRRVGTCSKVLKKEGQSCQADVDCASSRCSTQSKNCQAALEQSGRERCQSDLHCATGIYCNFVTGFCGDRRADGMACRAHTDCTSAYCRGETCTAVKVNGEACELAEECAAGVCTRRGIFQSQQQRYCGLGFMHGEFCEIDGDCFSRQCRPSAFGFQCVG